MSKKQFSAEGVTLGGLTGSPKLKAGVGYRFLPRQGGKLCPRYTIIHERET